MSNTSKLPPRLDMKHDPDGAPFGGDSLRPLATSLRPLAVLYDIVLPTAKTQPAPRRSRLGSRALMTLGAVMSLCLLGASDHESVSTGPTVVVGAANPRTTSTGKPQRWQHAELRVTLDPSIEALGPGAMDAVRAAFGTWLEAGAKLPSLVLENASTAGTAEHDGVNRVIAAPIDIEGHKHDLALTRSYVDDATGEILEADVIINLDYPFGNVDAQGSMSTGDQSTSCDDQYDLLSVVTHEAGHFFGLGEDWNESGTTMYFDTPVCDTIKRALHPQDTQAIDGLYADGFKSDDRSASCAMAQGQGHSAGTAAMLCAMAAVLAGTRRRKSRG